jgi:peptide-methionine (R)-S-oxide reductase
MVKISKSDTEWRNELGAEQYHVLREAGTEPAYSGALLDNNESGRYSCAACNNPLFKSDVKFDSSCGWPSFFETLGEKSVEYIRDETHGMTRTEVRCANCNSHLGHVFTDGPPPTGKRYCMNSLALKFAPLDI